MIARGFAGLAGFLAVLAAFAAPARAEVRGKWHSSPEEALATAQREKKPILAAAMDHG